MSPLYLSQITTGRRKPSAVMAGRIAKATGFKVSLESLRPDVYQMFKEQGATQQEPQHGSTDDAGDSLAADTRNGAPVPAQVEQGGVEHGVNPTNAGQ